MNSKEKTIILVCSLVVAILIIANRFIISYKDDITVIDVGNNILENDDFVKDQVIVLFDENVSKDEIISFLNNDLTITKYNELMDYSYVLTLNKEFKDRKEINSYCENLMQNNPSIKSCEANNIIKLDDCEKGPC